MIVPDAVKRIDIPIIRHSGGRLEYGGGDAVLKNKTGDITWRYIGAHHQGIGIVACARSGTVYMTKVLRALGYDVGHEAMGEDGSVGYHLVVVRPRNCLHQVRDPLKQINSMVAHSAWGWCDQVIKIPDYELLGCMQYWLMWNTMCEEFCVWRYRIEDLPNVWDEFCERIGHEKCEIPDIPKDTNTHKRKEDFRHYSWMDLINKDAVLASQIYDKAVEYGYSPVLDKESEQILGNRKAQVA